MQIVGKKIVEDFCLIHKEIKSQIISWILEAEDAEWDYPKDIKKRYPSASFLKNNYVVFNIKGNSYRLLALINYDNKVVLIKKIGTHAEYSKWGLRG